MDTPVMYLTAEEEDTHYIAQAIRRYRYDKA
jgi:hypothetical protein